jgi:glycosyltransferase involved in cell wall biosynthesis
LTVGLRDRKRGETDATYFDLHDLTRLNAVLAGHDVQALSADPTQAEYGIAGACRFVLGLLAASPSLRRRFPRALSEGPGGEFPVWLAMTACERFGVGPQGVANIRAAFAAKPGLRARRVFEVREDLRRCFPLGLTPLQRGEYLAWLVSRYGRSEFDLAAETALWFVFESDEDPTRGLAASFRWHPAWQAAVPHGLTRFGWNELKRWVAAEYRIDCRWLRRATLTDQFGAWDELQILIAARPDLAASFPNGADTAGVVRWAGLTPGVREHADGPWLARLAADLRNGLRERPGLNVLSHFLFPCGLQVEASYIADGLRASGFRIASRDIPVAGLPGSWTDSSEYADLELFPVSFVKIGASAPLDEIHRRAGLHPRSGVYRIAGWSWELEQFPREYADRAGPADEVWVPSEFCAAAVRRVMTDRPVLAMRPGVATPAGRTIRRADFGVPDGAFLVLYLFDMASTMARKNPLGLTRAFRSAFGRDDDAHLLIKVSRGEGWPDDLRRLQAAAGDNVTILDRVMPRAEVVGLMAACDCYTSLHRAEGFGLTVAEAMLLGKPVVATDYSATTEFLTEDNGLPIGYRMVPVTEGYQPHVRDAVWAEPDEEEAAGRLRWVFENRLEAAALGERARRHAEAVLCPVAAARQMADRIREIMGTRGGTS